MIASFRRGVELFALTFLIAASAAAQSADLFVNKTAPASATVGSNITFVVTIGNNGPDAALSASMTDTLPADVTFVSMTQPIGPSFTCSTPSVGSTGTVSCTLATFNAGDSAEFDIVVNVAGSAAGKTLINSASVASETPDNNTENNTSFSGTSVPGGNLADISITKSGPSSAPPNSDVAYTITVQNLGPNDATNVSFTDTLPNSSPAGNQMTFVSFTQNTGPSFNCGSPSTTTTCSIATFTNGSTATFTFTGHIPNGTASGTTYTNNTSVTSDNDPTPDNNSSSTTLTVSSVDVGVTKSAPATATAGSQFTYTITLTNGGPDTASDASFTDPLPAGINFISIVQNTGPAATCSGPTPGTNGIVACTISLFANGGSAQFTVTVQADPTVANGTVVTNTATASTASFDSNSNNNSSSASTTISAQADVAIAKSAPATAMAGNNISYAITVTNNGPSAASSVSWSDVLPAGTTFVSEVQNTGPTFTCTTGATISCSIASLTSGATATFTVTVTISPGVANGSTISNTATVTSTTPDNTPGNNSSTASTSVSTSADVSVAKSGPAVAPAGSNVVYTVTAANGGPSNALSVTLTESVPTGMTFVSANQTSGPAFSCSGTGPIVCTIASFASGASASFQFTFGVPIGTTAGTIASDTVTISSTTSDPTPANNSATATTTVVQPIPALSPLAMTLLAMALAMIGWVVMRR